MITASWRSHCFLPWVLVFLAGSACLDELTPPIDTYEGLAPPWAVLSLGDTVRLRLDKDTDTTPTVRWSSASPTVAAVDDAGLVRGLQYGTSVIRAEYGDSVAAAEVAVVPTVLVGAGDIATCTSDGDEATAALLMNIAGVVFTAGDNAYQNGDATAFRNCYHPSWGRVRLRTRPSPGGHDYFTPGATGYFDYFRASAGPPGLGYYSYDLGEWHVISLNSNIDFRASSAQAEWLRANLAAHPRQCTAVYWYLPRFSSGQHGSYAGLQAVWQILYDAGADVVIAGHDHHYERFAPQRPDGTPDAARGIRQFVVGTGGANLTTTRAALPASELKRTGVHGVLKLTLLPAGYRWEFVTVPDAAVVDSGTADCH